MIGRCLVIPCSATGVGYVTCMSHALDEDIVIDQMVEGSKCMAGIIADFAAEPA